MCNCRQSGVDCIHALTSDYSDSQFLEMATRAALKLLWLFTIFAGCFFAIFIRETRISTSKNVKPQQEDLSKTSRPQPAQPQQGTEETSEVQGHPMWNLNKKAFTRFQDLHLRILDKGLRSAEVQPQQEDLHTTSRSQPAEPKPGTGETTKVKVQRMWNLNENTSAILQNLSLRNLKNKTPKRFHELSLRNLNNARQKQLRFQGLKSADVQPQQEHHTTPIPRPTQLQRGIEETDEVQGPRSAHAQPQQEDTSTTSRPPPTQPQQSTEEKGEAQSVRSVHAQPQQEDTSTAARPPPSQPQQSTEEKGEAQSVRSVHAQPQQEDTSTTLRPPPSQPQQSTEEKGEAQSVRPVHAQPQQEDTSTTLRPPPSQPQQSTEETDEAQGVRSAYVQPQQEDLHKTSKLPPAQPRRGTEETAEVQRVRSAYVQPQQEDTSTTLRPPPSQPQQSTEETDEAQGVRSAYVQPQQEDLHKTSKLPPAQPRRGTEETAEVPETPTLILFWSTFFGERKVKKGNAVALTRYIDLEERACPVKCEVTTDISRWKEASAFIVHARDPYPLPPTKDVPWILFTLENPVYTPVMAKADYMSQFKMLMSYHLTSDFPTTNHPMPSLTPPVPFNEKRGIMATFTNCEEVRTNYMRELMKYVKVDSYGSCLRNAQGLVRIYGKDFKDEKIRLTRQYKFSLVFMNQDCEYFVDDRLYHALTSGSVPVYMGTDKVDEFMPGNLRTAIIKVKDFQTPKHLADYLTYLSHNEAAYNKYLEWKYKGFGDIWNTVIGRFWLRKREILCDICMKVSQKNWKFEKGLQPITCTSRQARDWGLEW